MDFKFFALIYIVGLGVLITALAFNLASNYLGITTWYEFILNLNKGFIEALGTKKLISAIFLFFIYPFILGVAAYYLIKFFKLG